MRDGNEKILARVAESERHAREDFAAMRAEVKDLDKKIEARSIEQRREQIAMDKKVDKLLQDINTGSW